MQSIQVHDQLKQLIESLDVSLAIYRGLTALHSAATVGDVKLCALLLDKGAPIDAQDGEGFTPLHYAVYSSTPGLCAFFLERGANVRIRSHYGLTALHHAAQSNKVAEVRLLIGAGLSSSDEFEGKLGEDDYLTPFQSAVATNAAEVVKIMIEECKEDPRQRTVSGLTMLELAEQGQAPHVERLLRSIESQLQIASVLECDGVVVEARKLCGPVI